MALEVGDRIAAIIGAPARSVSMHENVTSAALIALSTVTPQPSRNRIVCLAADFPSTIYLYRAQEASGFELTIVPGGRGSERAHRAHPRRHRRTDRVRVVVARPVQDVVHRRSGADRSPRARGRRTSAARRLSVGGHHSGGRHRARRRFLRGRLPEMALRRAGHRVSLHTSGCACRPAALHGLVLAPRAVRVRHRRTRAARRRDAHDERHAVDPRVLRRASRGSTSFAPSACRASVRHRWR